MIHQLTNHVIIFLFFFLSLKILNSRWVSSSRDVVALRQTLLNPDSCSEFTAFAAMKGDTLESNVHFWLEVQKFKVSSIERGAWSAQTNREYNRRLARPVLRGRFFRGTVTFGF